MMIKFLTATIILLNFSAHAQALKPIFCLDKDTFTPLGFSLKDDGVNGPKISFGGIYSRMVIGTLGLHTDMSTIYDIQDLEITLPGQPRKSVNANDKIVRHYTSFDLEGKSKATYLVKGIPVEKEVDFQKFEITKRITASRGDSYELSLTLRHTGKHFHYHKHYYAYSCGLGSAPILELQL